VWVVGLFVDVYLTTGCFDKSVKQVCQNMWWRRNPVGVQQWANFVAQSFIGFKWILGYNTRL